MPNNSNTGGSRWVVVNEMTLGGCGGASDAGSALPESLPGTNSATPSEGSSTNGNEISPDSSPATSGAGCSTPPERQAHKTPSRVNINTPLFGPYMAHNFLEEETAENVHYVTTSNPRHHTFRDQVPRSTFWEALTPFHSQEVDPKVPEKLPRVKVKEWIESFNPNEDDIGDSGAEFEASKGGAGDGSTIEAKQQNAADQNAAEHLQICPEVQEDQEDPDSKAELSEDPDTH